MRSNILHSLLFAVAMIWALSANAADHQWALPAISVANMRTAPRHAAELASQIVMGTPLKVIRRQGDWSEIQSPEGYKAWVANSSLAMKTDKEMDQWRSTRRAVVTSTYQTRCYSSPESKAGGRDVVSDLVNGCIVELSPASSAGSRAAIILPDGRKAWIDSSDITPIEQWAKQKFDAGKILDMAWSMAGQPYLWGGTSTKSLDCSGLVKVCYLANAIILRRDASQQAQTGHRIEAADTASCRAGDLLFFGNPTTGKVTHVAIYDHDGSYVHSSGRVKCNSLDKHAASYLPTPLLHCTRIDGCEGTDGIVRAAEHPWYFNQ